MATTILRAKMFGYVLFLAVVSLFADLVILYRLGDGSRAVGPTLLPPNIEAAIRQWALPYRDRITWSLVAVTIVSFLVYVMF